MNNNNLPEPAAVSTGHFFSFLSLLKNFFPTPSACANCHEVKQGTREHSMLLCSWPGDWDGHQVINRSGSAESTDAPDMLHGLLFTEQQGRRTHHAQDHTQLNIVISKLAHVTFLPDQQLPLSGWDHTSTPCTEGHDGDGILWGREATFDSMSSACSLSYGCFWNSRTWASDSSPKFQPITWDERYLNSEVHVELIEIKLGLWSDLWHTMVELLNGFKQQGL